MGCFTDLCYARAVSEGSKGQSWVEVAIDGPGVSPWAVTFPRLKQLISHIEFVFDALAKEQGLDPIFPALVEVKNSSAAFKIDAKDPKWPPHAKGFLKAVETRGQDNGPVVREGLGKLYRFPGKQGQMRIDSCLPGAGGRFFMPKPLDPQKPKVRYPTVAYGRIIGLLRPKDGGLNITVEIIDGGQVTVKGEAKDEPSAIRLFGKGVRMGFEADWDGSKITNRVLTELAEFKPSNLLDALERAKARLAIERPDLDPDALIKGLED